MAKFTRGQKVLWHGLFYDNDPASGTYGQLVDPTTVTFAYRKPDDNLVTLTVGSGVVKLATGHYTASIDYSMAGTWTRAWRSTGAAQAAQPDEADEVADSVLF